MGDLLHEGWMILAALIPSIGLLFLFWVILKHLIEGDRRERAAIRRWEAEQDAAERAAAADRGTSATGSGAADDDRV
ncbi:hypothetical protein GCM10009584_14790 [Ornithinimicrobium humiphilum]|uniref:Uncharacterized protein n=1 Tax=Ornithinimicrobium humiphilum TaxID=125288 RepID=A0A543KKH7_9MICO|nr:hypothetical protein [Ornithinimicrobium humiphilum]TQM95571.1 hypothetical protein FB476_0416 [Ornithinimicrobium humiphilum]